MLTEDGWQNEIIDRVTNSHYWPALVLDKNDRPHISYNPFVLGRWGSTSVNPVLSAELRYATPLLGRAEQAPALVGALVS